MVRLGRVPERDGMKRGSSSSSNVLSTRGGGFSNCGLVVWVRMEVMLSAPMVDWSVGKNGRTVGLVLGVEVVDVRVARHCEV